jgi:hypothetical protein
MHASSVSVAAHKKTNKHVSKQIQTTTIREREREKRKKEKEKPETVA